jgi:hypothetical protein
MRLLRTTILRRSSMRNVRLLVWLAASSILGCGAGAPEGTGEPSENSESGKGAGLTNASGQVGGTDGQGLNVRAEASASSAVVDWLAEGSSVGIACQVEGDTVGGTSLWDYLPDHGGFVSDWYVNTGYAARIPGVPDCNAPPSEGGDCGGLDFAGECDGATLRWCEDGSLHAYDCASIGKACGWQDESVGNNCVSDGGSNPGNGTLLTVSEIVGGAGYSVTQGYGPSDFYGGYGYCQSYGDWGGVNVHCGTDVGIGHGTDLYIPADATVIDAGGTGYFEDETNAAAGELEIVLGDGTHVILGHMSYIDLYPGQWVGIGTYAGNSGTANGPHLHLEVRVPSGAYASGLMTVDPVSYFGP